MMPTTEPTTRTTRTRLGAAAGLLGVAAALAALTGAGPVPSVLQLTGAVEDVRGSCDEPEHAGDAACVGALTARRDDSPASTAPTSSTTDGATPSTAPGTAAGEGVRLVSAGEAGSLLVSVTGDGLQLLTASPGSGWRAEVERASGREVEVTFRSGSVRVDVHVELEDGQVRERVRTRDDASDSETRVEDGVVVRQEGPGESDDSSGPGSGGGTTSGHGTDDGPGDDHGGHGTDDGPGDDHGGHGTDDGPGHD